MTGSAGDIPGRIFISYRREETAYPAAWLFDRLAGRFGRDQVFKDVDSIEPGDDFVEVITTAVGSCHVLLALIGGRWLTIADQDGQRRLDNPSDFVRLEIEVALARNVRVIPILVDGARMPRAEELPASLAKLARRQALELGPSRFDADSRRLFRVLGRTVGEAQEQARREAERAVERHREQVEQPPPPRPAPPKLTMPITSIDFGRLALGGQSPERRVRLGNTGSGRLNARGSTSASWLKLRQTGDELVITVDTSVAGEHEGKVAIDSDGGSATIHVRTQIGPAPPPTAEALIPETPKAVHSGSGPQAPNALPQAPTDQVPVKAPPRTAHKAPGPYHAGRTSRRRRVIFATGAAITALISLIVAILFLPGKPAPTHAPPRSILAVRAPVTGAVVGIPDPFPVRVLASQGSAVVASGTVVPNADLTQLVWNKPLPAGTYQVCVQPPALTRFTDKSTGVLRGWTCVVAHVAPGSQTQVTFHLTEVP